MKNKIKRNKFAIIGLVLVIVFISKVSIIKNMGDIVSNEIAEMMSVDDGGSEPTKIKGLTIVSAKYKVGKKYKPSNLKVPNITFSDRADKEEKYMQDYAADKLEKLVNQAKKEGIKLYGLSAYRSYVGQDKIFNDYVKNEGIEIAKLYAAKPGESEHQTGLAIDMTNESGYFKEDTKEAKWLKKNAHKFGYIIRYPKGKEDITGINYEPWHIRYVGEEVANKIYNSNITLEEYIGS